MTRLERNARSMRQKLREEVKIDGETNARAAHYSAPRVCDMVFNPGRGPITILPWGKKGTSHSPLTSYSSFKKGTELQKEREVQVLN